MSGKSLLNQPGISRGLKNNNPGNLIISTAKWQGKISPDKNTDHHFEQFQSLAYGIRAMIINITTLINRGNNTLTKLVYAYAPPNENDTTNYMNYVSKKTGIPLNSVITPTRDVLAKIVKAKIEMENGATMASKYVSDGDINEAFSLISNIEKKKLPQSEGEV